MNPWLISSLVPSKQSLAWRLVLSGLAWVSRMNIHRPRFQRDFVDAFQDGVQFSPGASEGGALSNCQTEG